MNYICEECGSVNDDKKCSKCGSMEACVLD